jgi:hypothetical protein
MRSSIVRRVCVAPVLVAALFIAGCDKGPSGVYKAEGPVPATIEFKSGKAIFSMMGESKESDYSVNGDKIKIAKDPEGKPMTLTLNSDGSITGLGGLRFVKTP